MDYRIKLRTRYKEDCKMRCPFKVNQVDRIKEYFGK